MAFMRSVVRIHSGVPNSASVFRNQNLGDAALGVLAVFAKLLFMVKWVDSLVDHSLVAECRLCCSDGYTRTERFCA